MTCHGTEDNNAVMLKFGSVAYMRLNMPLLFVAGTWVR